jgi:hypothetical protein
MVLIKAVVHVNMHINMLSVTINHWVVLRKIQFSTPVNHGKHYFNFLHDRKDKLFHSCRL